MVPPVNSEMKSLCGKDVKPVWTLQHLENVQRAAIAQVEVASQNQVFGVNLTAHLSSLSEGLPRAQEEFSAALAELANAHPQDVSESPSHPHRLRRILAPSSAVVAPPAGAGDKGVGPNPLVPIRLSTHGRFCSFLAGLRARRQAAHRLRVAVASHHG